ncbi:carboxylate-amine ligase [Pseudomonas vanderleydeniana]|uniref:Putative glutamate--cysteine ligase 2 n=1 Tax=Pseudomonas vanderleydeniana TaxID=2745495 RepID=A0A9E6PHH5_9PSED|nr:carboxylate-amine ligase [Pseudomonas vanderleydeniana]QXI26320.1 carboxylate-amine ligase [Pseudomonas vanderleydeniana]
MSFDHGLPQHVGVEEEYFITDLQSRQMVAEPSIQVLQDCREALGEGFCFEMFQGQIEWASPVFEHLAQASECLRQRRQALDRALDPHGLGFLCAGTHPLALWRQQKATPQAHFQQLFSEYAQVAQRSVLSGLHVHAQVPLGIDRIGVMNEVLPWLPLLLALSASSPFWQGHHSGYCSYRQVACDEWPRMGAPEYLRDERAYRHYRLQMRRMGALRGDTPVWWGIRPSLRYPTLELRLTDACPCVEDVLTLAGLYSVMVRHACLLAEPGQRYTLTHHWLFKENRCQARRWSTRGRYMMDPEQPVMDLQQWLALAQQTFGPTAQALGQEQVFTQAGDLLREGTSAERQLQCFQAQPAHWEEPLRCRAVVDLLMAQSRGKPPPGVESL